MDHVLGLASSCAAHRIYPRLPARAAVKAALARPITLSSG